MTSSQNQMVSGTCMLRNQSTCQVCIYIYIKSKNIYSSRWNPGPEQEACTRGDVHSFAPKNLVETGNNLSSTAEVVANIATPTEQLNALPALDRHLRPQNQEHLGHRSGLINSSGNSCRTHVHTCKQVSSASGGLITYWDVDCIQTFSGPDDCNEHLGHSK